MGSKELFISELAIGDKWAQYVAEQLNDRGVLCAATEMRVAQTKAEIQEFTETDKDIVLNDGTGHFEVKSRRLNFTNNFNFPFETAFIDTVSGWEQKAEKPLAIIIVSQVTGGMAVAMPDTQPYWETITTFDRVRQFTDTWYTVHRKHLLSFKEFVQELK